MSTIQISLNGGDVEINYVTPEITEGMIDLGASFSQRKEGLDVFTTVKYKGEVYHSVGPLFVIKEKTEETEKADT